MECYAKCLIVFLVLINWLFVVVHQSENLGDDIIGMAVNGMLAADHDMSSHFPDPGALPPVNTIFMTWSTYLNVYHSIEDGIDKSNKIKSNLKAMTGVDQAQPGSFAIQRHIVIIRWNGWSNWN